MTDEPHERPTTASIDRRVERLEASQAATDKKVDELTFKLGYMDEFNKLKFGTLEAQNGALSSKLDSFMARIDQLITDSYKQAADLQATPLGRQIDGRLTRVETDTDKHQSDIDRVQGAIWLVRGMAMIGAALGGIATALQLVHLVRIP